MSDLIQQIQESDETARAEALEAYREVLLRHAAPDKGDPKKLQAAMAVLGKTADDLREDLRVFQRAAELASAAAQAADPDLKAELDSAGEALALHRAESARIAAERDRAEVDLLAAFQQLQRQQGRGHEARRQLRAFEARHWALLGLPQPALGERREPSSFEGRFATPKPDTRLRRVRCGVVPEPVY